MIRILHVSDLHLGESADYDQKRLLKAFFTDVGTLHAQVPVDLVVFTGDLSVDGSRSALATARALFLEALQSQLSLGSDRFVLVPGNHDADRSKITPVFQDGLREQLRDSEAAERVFASDANVNEGLRRTEEWRALLSEFGHPPSVAAGSSLGGAYHVEIYGKSIGIAALDSAWCSLGGDEDKGALAVGTTQLLEVLTAIESCDLQIVAVHHPLDWLARHDSDLLRIEFERRRLVVLSGHTHVEDPLSIASLRGAAIYARGGCLYESREYPNGYEVLDLDLDRESVAIHLRRWFGPPRFAFDAAVDLTKDGVQQFSFPRVLDAVPVGQIAFSQVLAGLGEIAAQRSIVADMLPDQGSIMPDEILVEPRFWALPFKEAVAAGVSRDQAPEQADPRATLLEEGVCVMNGDHDSGVSSALIWLLAIRYEEDAGRLPIVVSFDAKTDRRHLDRAVLDGTRRLGLNCAADQVPPMAIAVDDVTAKLPKALGRLAAYIAEHPEHRFILGCHDDEHDAIEAAVRENGLTVRRLFLGPFGRRELRDLVRSLIGATADEFVDQVYEVMRGENLPRSPLIMAALIAVLSKGGDLQDVNVSALLTAYVSLLLGGEELADSEGLGMDYRRREHLLGAFAHHLFELGSQRIERLNAERFLGDYFATRGFGPSASPGRVLDSLIDRRVLVEDLDGVGFRHDAIDRLFGAKWMAEDASFEDCVMENCLDNAGLIRHAAGLRRNDRELLIAVATAAEEIESRLGAELSVELFDRIDDRHGWSNAADLEGLKSRLAADGPTTAEVDQHLDDFDDRYDVEGDDSEDEEPTLSDIDRLFGGAMLLSNVLRSSELVDDLGLKVRLLKQAIHAWSLLTVVTAIREDQTSNIESMLDEIVDDDEEQLVRQIVGLVLTLYIAFGVVQELGAPSIQVVLAAAMDDAEFMESTAHALLSTVLYCQLRLASWPDRLRKLLAEHGTHPYVRTFVRVFAEVQYKATALRSEDESRLESLLADIYAVSTRARGPAAVMARAQTRGEIIRQLREARSRAPRSPDGLDAFADVLDDELNAESDQRSTEREAMRFASAQALSVSPASSTDSGS